LISIIPTSTTKGVSFKATTQNHQRKKKRKEKKERKKEREIKRKI
jgi:hypothetical protein